LNTITIELPRMYAAPLRSISLGRVIDAAVEAIDAGNYAPESAELDQAEYTRTELLALKQALCGVDAAVKHAYAKEEFNYKEVMP